MLAVIFNSIRDFWRSHCCAAFVAALILSPVIHAAPPAGDPLEAQAQVDNARNSVPGLVNSGPVYVRCGPGESYYPTLKLDKGAAVIAVGQSGDWLKIVPPDGSFCYISKAFVDRNGDGTAGKVNKDDVKVRAGSTQNTLKIVPLCTLSTGMDVKIIGEQDEYWKIVPPEGKAFVYIPKQSVDPDPRGVAKPIDPVAVNEPKVGETPVKPRNVLPLDPPDRASINERPGAAVDGAAGNPAGNGGAMGLTTKPSGATPADGAAGKPIDDPAAAEAKFDNAEAEFLACSGKPLDEQPIAALTAQYEAVVASGTLAGTMHRIAETRLATLKLRAGAADEFARAKAAQEVARKKQMTLEAERKELEEQLAAKSVTNFTAVGELQTSSLQLGTKTLYRLTDPANGRTVCYIRTDDGKFLSFMGKFIGVKGDLSTEPQLSLKVIAATDAAVIEPGKLNHGVIATIVPPSMLGADEASAAAHVEPRP